MICMNANNEELLNFIFKNAEMGKETTAQLIDIVEDENYKRILESQLEEYTRIYDISVQKLKKHNEEIKPINPFSKASAHTMINMRTLTNKSPSHISDMLIKGTTMGIVDMTKKIKEYPDADEEILDLANRLLELEEKNIEECKKYL